MPEADGARVDDEDGERPAEPCGRCAMTNVVGATGVGDAGHDAEEADGSGAPDQFAGAHIELSDRELRLANAPAVAFGRVKRRLDQVASRLTYGR